MKFNLKVNKRANNFSAKRKSQYTTVLGTYAALKYKCQKYKAKMFPQQSRKRQGKCPQNDICTPEEDCCCLSAPALHGESRDINGTECRMRKGQALGFVVSNRGDFFIFYSFKIASIILLVFLIQLQNSDQYSTWLPPGRPGIQNNSQLQKHPGCRGKNAVAMHQPSSWKWMLAVI